MKFAFILKEFISNYNGWRFCGWKSNGRAIITISARNIEYALEHLLECYYDYDADDLRYEFQMKKRAYHNDYQSFLSYKLSAMNDKSCWISENDVNYQIPLVELFLEDEKALNHFKKDNKNCLAKALKDELKFTKQMKTKHKNICNEYFDNKIKILNNEIEKLSQQ